MDHGVGFAAVDVSARVLTQIFVEPNRTGQGVGRQLLAWVQQLMPDRFCLRTLEDNFASRAFYERHGPVAGGTQINSVNGMSTIEYCWAPASANNTTTAAGADNSAGASG